MKSAFRISVLLALCGAAFFYYYQGKVRAREAVQAESAVSALAPERGVEIPRNQQPMGAHTAYFQKNSIDIAERTYTYYSYGPFGAAATGDKYPLVLVLHGAPGNAYAASYLAMPATMKKYPAFIIAPVLADGNFWATPDGSSDGLDAAVDIVRDFAKSNPVDMNRVYVIGCSDGGTGTFGAVRDYPDFFAAAVAISGYWDEKDAARMTQTPLLVIHGTHDQVIPIKPAADTANAIRSLGGRAEFMEITDMGHECPSERIYADPLWQWLFSKRLQQRTPVDR